MERDAAPSNRRRKTITVVLVLFLLYCLAGAVIAPWALKRIAVQQLQETYGAALEIERVAINPLALSLELDNLQLQDPEGALVVGARQIFVNLQLSSIFNWAYTLAEFRVLGPRVDIARDNNGGLNVDFLLSSPTEDNTAEADEASGMPRFLIHNLSIEDFVLNWEDAASGNTVSTRMGPASVAIEALNTLPDRSGRQTVRIATDDLGTLNWTGSINLNPFSSSGDASIEGATFSLLSAYLRQDIGFDIDDGTASAAFAYNVSQSGDGVTAQIHNLNLQISDLGIETLDPVDDDSGRMLTLPDLQLAIKRIAWPEAVVEGESLRISGGLINLLRDTDNTLNVVPKQSATEQQPGTDDSATTPWNVSLGLVAIEDFAVAFEDRGVIPSATGGMSNIDLEVTGLSNQPNTVFPTSLSFEGQAGGRVALQGTLQAIPTLDFLFNVRAEQAGLKNLQPYVAPLADMAMTSGNLNLEGQLQGNDQQPLFFEGGLAIADLELTETDEGSKLGSWDTMAIDRIRLDFGNNDLQISEIAFDGLYAEVVISESGAINLGRISKDSNPTDPDQAGDESATSATEPDQDDAAGDSAGMDITVGRIVLNEAAVDFSDFSLPLPFAANITGLSGDMTTISTSSQEPSTLDFEGAVDEFGMVSISGALTPLVPEQNTAVAVSFQNVDIPKFTSYSIPFAGREIAEGRLGLELEYSIKDGQLQGKNNIVISEFALGDKVPHPDATSLPLDLAVALLKDVDGNIDLDLPVSGDINDPQFSFGGIVGKAIANLIVKIVASPFMLLGNLVGVEAGELDNLLFLAGRPDLTPPEMEKIAKLAEALQLRPELSLAIPPTTSAGVDTSALQVSAMEQQVEARIAELQDEGGMYAENRRAVLENLFREAYPDSTELEALQTKYTAAADAENAGQFDSVAYTAEVQQWVTELQVIGEPQLTDLGMLRAAAVRDALLASEPALADRISITEAEQVTSEPDDTLKMPVSLSAEGSGG